MSEIDWETFRVRVSAGTLGRTIWHFDVVVLENYPYAAMEKNIEYRADWPRVPCDHQEIGENRLKCQRIIAENSSDTQLSSFISPDSMRYLIDGAWKTFDEVMA